MGEDLGFLDVWSADPDSVKFAVSRARRLLSQCISADVVVPETTLEPRIAFLLDDFRAQAQMVLVEYIDELFADVRLGKPCSTVPTPREVEPNASLMPVRTASAALGFLASD